MPSKKKLTLPTTSYRVVEICAGAGGQALGLEKAGFEHELAVELDRTACDTLELNRPGWKVACGDVASIDVWNPAEYEGVDLLAGGVPCPPFSIAGKQLGASDERDLFAWAVETAGLMKPRALMLENVRGLSAPRFAAYRQRILDRLTEFGYVADWRLLHASDFGVPQLRPRFVLVALRREDAAYFHWPEPAPTSETVGTLLKDLMGEGGWRYLDEWVEVANDIAPTLVGGSKKHGGADLGPTRAKRAWLNLGVSGMGIANDPPTRDSPHPRDVPPKLTLNMVARLQGWKDGEWEFAGLKTATYRQIGNAFPPPVAQAIGSAIIAAFDRTAERRDIPELATETVHDAVYRALQSSDGFISATRLLALSEGLVEEHELERRIADLSRDFEVEIKQTQSGVSYRLGAFKGFVGQEDHGRHEYIATFRSRVS
ncbi:DNA (cytosine-5-)-methyltransferase [Rhodococcus hoagii]|uniref:DNA cytosine methyltransferase n=1 Tax=Rhodococcus hoagii TaxID=43767 RepID=UPI0007CD9B2E|nr:DNA cytosine methyltransferase [Prescottella equi]MBM4536114.1 DNA (cytosine-5-)-methyltransferase [Prescottella equi]NKR81289.1 DNA (cytosine-5-)-methyltransferase [Prescottella equi]NKT03114.1 DNA (cytosine-5-)-methyltransferase [Prescottella equi]ORJ93929.1 cytosine methyltransferase [Prescottella equi]ORL05442.1 cytosine methyltransferase [Prescottella equi]